MDHKTLNHFCAASRPGIRVDISTPFSVGDYTYATNGSLLIRVPRLADVEERTSAPAIYSTGDDPVGRHFLQRPSRWKSVPSIAGQKGMCVNCWGTKQAIECPECEGQGTIQLKTDYNEYGASTCKTCQGLRQIPSAEYDKLCENYVNLNIPKKVVDCQACDKEPELTTAGMEINGLTLSTRMLSQISLLPGVMLGVTGDPAAPVMFRFDGGDGLIMPTRKKTVQQL